MIEVRDLTVAYGGHVAVANVNLRASTGAITGLIGPNGAGKTSLFNACSGLLRPASGTVHLFDTDVTRAGPAARAQLGLGRTFQRVEICSALNVRANVALGPEGVLVGSNPLRQLRSRRSEQQSIDAATSSALELCGLSDIAAAPSTTLSTGQRRLVELARVLAGGFKLLLLDEPSAGLDEQETDRFAEILLGAVATRGVGILLVEHDMRLVMAVCDHVYVLDFGNLIFEGPAAALHGSDVVRAAYLGDGVR